jgi:glycosyltransferase involved in cell wall biosynthesis
MSEEKRPDRAVELAEQTGMKLKIVAKVDKNDLEYYEGIKDKVEGSKHVEFLGELGGAAKDSFLGNAYALLFPIDWPEPFGLVMIEALACGTPVVAWRNGSVPEIIEDGVTGFIVDNMKDAAEAVRKVATLNRQHCRQSFLKRFTVSRMASDYLAIYRRMVEAHTRQAANKKAHPDGVQSKRTATANFLAK